MYAKSKENRIWKILLTMEQKQRSLEIAQDMLNNANSNPNFLNTVITGDESWVYGYDPETKMQSSQWKHPTSLRPKKAQQVRSNVKVMLAVFFDSRVVVHHEYAPQGHTIVAFVMLCGANDRICGQQNLAAPS
jgi:hypothetical protein